jgi:glucose-1-phosphate cytidylyltransferase
LRGALAKPGGCDLKVVILCGGLGTRLREETEFRPKPLVDVGGHPLLWHIMKLYAHYGFNEFVLCLGYRGNMIKDYFLNYEAMEGDFTITLGHGHPISYHGQQLEQDFRVTLADTGQDTMTGGRIKRVEPYISDDIFMCTYGDGVGDVDIKALVDFHRSHGRLATVTAVQPQSRYGTLEFQTDGLEVRHFNEKPMLDGLISAGFFVFDRKVLSYLHGDDCVLEQEPLEHLAADGQLMAYQHSGMWQPMDTYRDVLHLNEIWATGRAPWKVWD